MLVRISEKVLEAQRNNVPVVALESTIISHGMPYPKNVETALNVEKIIEENGCVAATIGIVDGVAIIGLSHEEIEEFGKKEGVCKVSRRDLPVIISEKLWGATTVSTTMILANYANIEVFVTGGIGGFSFLFVTCIFIICLSSFISNSYFLSSKIYLSGAFVSTK